MIAQGRAYPVDPETHSLAGVPLEGVTSVLHVSGWVVLTGFTDLEVLSPQGLQCRAPRVAWDGIRNLRIEGSRLLAEGWNAVADAWRPIEIDLDARRVVTSAYE